MKMIGYWRAATTNSGKVIGTALLFWAKVKSISPRILRFWWAAAETGAGRL